MSATALLESCSSVSCVALLLFNIHVHRLPDAALISGELTG